MKKAIIARSPIGIFAFSEGKLLYYKIWDRKRAIDLFLAKELDQEVKTNLADYHISESEEAYLLLRQNFRDYARNLCALTDEQINEFLSNFSVALSTRRLQGAIGRDKLVVQSVRSLEDLNRAINIFSERLYEWFSLHYPEMKNANIVEIVSKHGRRENIKGFSKSVGVELSDEDEKALREFAYTIQNLNREKTELEKYVAGAMTEVAKNFSCLIDPLLGARMMALAGSLEKLGRMPASTIQLLGAEKALFRHLHEKGKSPKYGIIYNSELIQKAPAAAKGKVARVLSSKLMLAARIDFYSGRDETERLKRELDEELKRVLA